MILDHAFNVQSLNSYERIGLSKFVAKLVQEITPLAADFEILLC